MLLLQQILKIAETRKDKLAGKTLKAPSSIGLDPYLHTDINLKEQAGEFKNTGNKGQAEQESLDSP